MKATKRGARMLAFAVCIATVLAVAAPALAANIVGYSTVTAAVANVYSDSSKATIIGTFVKGDVLAVESKTSDGAMFVVRQSATSTETGYVSASDISRTQSRLASNKTVASMKSPDGAAAVSGTPGVIYNVKADVNFRATASKSGKLLGKLKLNQAVTILGTEGDFYKLSVNGQTGYVSKDYVQVTGSTSTNTGTGTTTALSGTGYMKASAKLYSEAATTSKSISTLAKNTVVTLKGENGNFYELTAGTKTGFVEKKNVELDPVVTELSGKAKTKAAASLYKYASTTRGKLVSVPKGKEVTLTGEAGNFYRATYSGKTGFIEKTKVELTESSGASGSVAGGTKDTGKITVGKGEIKVAANTGTVSSLVSKGLAAAKKINTDTLGYINIVGTNVQQPILYNAKDPYYYANRNINKKKDSKGTAYTFYSGMMRNNVVTAHNMRKSGTMFHELHHIYDKTMGFTSCQTTDAKCKNNNFSTAPDLRVANKRIFEISMYGYTQWEVWAMYRTEKNEPKTTINYNIKPLSTKEDSPATVKTWIEYQKNRSEIKFNTPISTDDIFITIYTCGRNYDSSTAQSRLYIFLKAVK